MQKKTISQRLERVAAFVPDGAKLLDVGSDHAYLPICLVQQGRIEKALAGEVVEGPFQSAQKNVSEHRLTEQIEVRLANGLAAFEVEDQIDTIVIAGMGGRLISEILENGRAKLRAISRLILQPNNREDELRSWLVSNGFHLLAEDILEEAGKVYDGVNQARIKKSKAGYYDLEKPKKIKDIYKVGAQIQYETNAGHKIGIGVTREAGSVNATRYGVNAVYKF